MRIAQVAPLFESVPPKVYGGTERVVSYLTEALVALGHEVSLFASGDSQTAAQLVPVCERALRLEDLNDYHTPFDVLQLERVLQLSHDFDVVHFHGDCIHYPLLRRQPIAHLSTFHGRLDVPGLAPLMQEFADMPVSSISTNQRKPLPFLNWRGTVYHGLPPTLYRPGDGGGYLAFLGRISPEKRLDRAIDVAVETGIPLKIAAKVDPVNLAYYEQEIKPRLAHPLVEYVGEINDVEKQAFLGNAIALLFLIDWPEPFGLAVIESLACGTPVIAYPHGALPEILGDQRAGRLVRSHEQAVTAVAWAQSMDRTACRALFDARFTAERMARGYLAIYQNLVTPEVTPAAGAPTGGELLWPPATKSEGPRTSSIL